MIVKVSPTINEFDKYDEPRLHMEQLFKASLVEFDLPLRILIPLEKAGIKRVGDLLKYDRHELLQFSQVGQVSLNALDKVLEFLDLEWGMNKKGRRN